MTATQTWLVHLSDEECGRRLASCTLGRVGVIVSGRPEVFPVNHVVDPRDGNVAFPTNDGTKLHAAVDWPSVAFEVDGIDPNGDGWSVMLVGRAEEIRDQATVDRLRAERGSTWEIPGTERWLRIVPAKVSGRRIHASAG